jgi:Domain of unknown function (DUF4265)
MPVPNVMSSDGSPTAKVLFRVVGEEGRVNVETLWAFDLGHDRYRLDNMPFYAYSVSLGDVVLAPIDPAEQRPTFKTIVEKCGNRTVRIFFDEPVEPGSKSMLLLEGLVDMGCEYEGATSRYVAVTVPPGVELSVVRDYLVENALTWGHADPSYTELYPNDA